MGYFRELPNVLYQSPLVDKNSTKDYIFIKNIFRRSKLIESLRNNLSVFDKYVIKDGDRPDTIANDLYDDPTLDYVVILMAGITNITHEWPLQDYQMYDFALKKYGSEIEMNKIKHYVTQEIVDSQNRQILPPDIIVDEEFKLDGSSLRYQNRFTLKSEQGNIQLDDKFEYTVKTDNIAIPVTNFAFEILKNEEKRKIDVLRIEYLQQFINDMRDAVRYAKNSSTISSDVAITENTNIIP